MTRQRQLIPMGVGERLKHRRESRKLTVEVLAEQLKIDLPVLNSIEQDKLDHLAPLYRRGYIRTYARHLGFEPNEIQEMLEFVGNEEPQLHTVFPEAGRPDPADRWIKATSYVLASLLIGTLAWQFTHEAVRLSQQGTDNVTTTASGQDNTQLSNPAGTAPRTRHVNASIAALEKLPQRNPDSTDSAAEAWSAIRAQDTDAQSQEPSGSGMTVLSLSASGDSWVEIQDANGTQLELDIVRGGATKEYSGAAPFTIQFGRASALTLTQNGQSVDLSPFTVGDVTQMILEADGNARTAVAPTASDQDGS